MVGTYRVTHQFARIEALGSFGQNGRVNDPADPLTLTVIVTEASSVSRIVEQRTDAFRLATGLWAIDLSPDLYDDGKTYVVHFKYQMTPGNDKVDRVNFKWGTIPKVPRDSSSCIVYGRVSGVDGSSYANVIVSFEQFRDYVTLNTKIGTLQVVTDAFGNWYAELPHGQVYRVLVGSFAKNIKIPTAASVSLQDIPTYMPSDGRKDKFGYPMP